MFEPVDSRGWLLTRGGTPGGAVQYGVRRPPLKVAAFSKLLEISISLEKSATPLYSGRCTPQSELQRIRYLSDSGSGMKSRTAGSARSMIGNGYLGSEYRAA